MGNTATFGNADGVVEVSAPTVRTSKTKFVARLADSLRQCDKVMRPFRSQRTRFIKAYAGPYYGTGLQQRQPMPMEYRLVTVLVPYLAFDAEVMVTTRYEELDPFARLFTERIEHRLDEMRFNETMRLVTLDSLFGKGITHTALAESEKGNYSMDAGKVHVDRVSFDDYLWDTSAYTRYDMAFEGHRYARTLDWAEEAGGFEGDGRKALMALSNAYRGAMPEATRRLTSSERDARMSLKDRVLLADVWLPDENVVLTVAGNPDWITQVLRERDYQGPEFGPYDTFKYSDVPDNMMPVPVMSAVRDLAEVINELARKIKRQAERQKDIGVYSLGHEEAADAVRTAPDGSMVGVPDRNQIDVLSFGGVNDDNWKSMAWFREAFNLVAGNPELLGGGGPQSNTASQDKMNLANASGTLSDWRQQHINSRNSIVRKVAMWEWTDPVARDEYSLSMPSGIKIPVRWTPEFREGDFLDYNLEFSHFPRRNTDADEQYRRTVAWLTTVGLPLAEIGAQQGVHLNVMEAAMATARQAGVDVAPWIFQEGAPLPGGGRSSAMNGVRTRGPDNRVVRRMPAKPEAYESDAEKAGVA